MAIIAIIRQLMDESGKSKRIQLWVGLAISLACMAAIFIFVKPAEIIDALKDARYELWLLAILSVLLFMVLRAIRWQFMLNARSSSEASLPSGTPSGVPYGTVFNIQNIGYFLTYILPFRLGDVARAVLIGNVPPITISRGLSTMVAERVLDLLFMVILFPIAVSSLGEMPIEIRTAVQLASFLAIAAAVVLIGAANQRQVSVKIAAAILDRIPKLNTLLWSRRLNDLLLGLNVFTRIGDAILLIILSILVWLPIIGGYYVGLRGMNLDVTVMEAAFVVCISAFALSIPSTPGGIGPQDAGISFAVASVLGQPGGAAVTFAFLFRGVNYLVLGILAIIGITFTGETFGSVIKSTQSFVQNRTN
jgi:uncharacterized protein (TIRG00374 family)